jgi:hypothetical protein
MIVDIATATQTWTAANRHGVAQLASPINRSVIDLGAGRMTEWGSLSVVELGTTWSPCTMPPKYLPASPPHTPKTAFKGCSSRSRAGQKDKNDDRALVVVVRAHNHGILPQVNSQATNLS